MRVPLSPSSCVHSDSMLHRLLLVWHSWCESAACVCVHLQYSKQTCAEWCGFDARVVYYPARLPTHSPSLHRVTYTHTAVTPPLFTAPAPCITAAEHYIMLESTAPNCAVAPVVTAVACTHIDSTPCCWDLSPLHAVMWPL